VDWGSASQFVITVGSWVVAIFVIVDKLRWTGHIKDAYDRAAKSKGAQIALSDEALKTKDTQIALAQETIKAKDVVIERLKLDRAPDALAVLKASEEIRERALTELQQQLNDQQAFHQRTKLENDSLQYEIRVLRASVDALQKASSALHAEQRAGSSLGSIGARGQSSGLSPADTGLVDDKRLEGFVCVQCVHCLSLSAAADFRRTVRLIRRQRTGTEPESLDQANS